MEKLQIGDMIRVLRRNKGITQEQLAEILDVSTPAICKWESGQSNPDINMLPVIARFFQVSIDFLLGFSTELKQETIKTICDEISQKFVELPFMDAQKEWIDCLKQFPACFPLRYELASIGVFHLSRAGSQEEMFSFTIKIIDIFEQCSKSDELKIKQGSFFQMANLYIMLQDFDKAQAILNQIPAQLVNPQLLLSMIYIQKKDYERATKHIQENLFRAMNDIIGGLGNMINIQRVIGNGNTDTILDLHYKTREIISIFGMEPLYGVGVNLQIALICVQKKDYIKAKAELEKTVKILEKYPQGSITIKNIPFFKEMDAPIQDKSGQNFTVEAYRLLLEQIFSISENENDFLELKRKIESLLE